MNSFDPIAAISTPYGKGGIAVIRMSGENAIKLASSFFHLQNGSSLCEVKGGCACYGHIVNNGAKIDDGIATVFRAPRSYTGEDTVEISCHGGIILTQKVLTVALSNGFRLASGGEFTKRAFLNGKISLTKAEAVIGLIDAENDEQLKLCSAITSGAITKEIENICDNITNLLASIYAYIDYPDEDLTDIPADELKLRVQDVRNDVKRLTESYRVGRAVNEGIKTVIVGKPNAGKSSVLNRILGYERAIVTDVPGTTRDTVEESVNIGRVTMRLCDTAGIRTTDDVVEKLGIDRSIVKLKEADLVLAVFDSSRELDGEDSFILDRLKECECEIICIVNKTDVCGIRYAFPYNTVYVSSVTGEGFDTLYKIISDLYVDEKLDYNTTAVLANSRQHASSLNALNFIERALDSLNDGFTQDVAGMDLELALSSLREIDGRGVNDEITDRIFSRFCVGK
jgi:tRNA modification GTPase